MCKHRIFTAAVGLASLGLGSVASAAPQTFTDEEFNDSDWTVVELLDETFDDSATFFGLRLSTGGNPGGHRSLTNSWSHDGIDSVTVTAGHLRAQADVDPSTDGAIGSVEFSFDARTTSTTYPLEAAIVFFPVLEQDGSTYSAGSGIEAGINWAGLTAGPWNADDFTIYTGSGPLHPDFSDTGGPITFGFAASSGPHNLAGVYLTEGGVDNWSVTVDDPVDDPDAGVDVDGGEGGGGGTSGGGSPPPVAGPPGAAIPREDDGCAIRASSAGAPLWWIALGAAGLICGLRRRRRGSRP